MFLKLLISDKKLQEISNLYFGKTRKELREQLGKELLKKLVPVLFLSISLIVIAISFLVVKETVSISIERPTFGTVAIKKEFVLEMEDRDYPIELEIAPEEYLEEEIELLHQKAEAYLDSVILAENKSFSEVSKDLYFPSYIQETGEEIRWRTEVPWIISSKGQVTNEELEKETQLEIKAEIFYGSEYRVYERLVTVVPKVYTEQEQKVVQAIEYLQQLEQESRTETYLQLPEEVLGWKLVQKEDGTLKKELFLILLAIVLPILVHSRFFGNLEKLQKQRKEQAENSYSEFITKLSLLLATGISIRQSFFRLAKEYEERYGEEHILTIELKVTKQELEHGYSESIVYDTFGKRMDALVYQRMASLLTQNVSKGIQGIQGLLLQEAKEAMEQERANIKIKGEQAGTKLLLPMMGMLVLVFAILLVPAFWSF